MTGSQLTLAETRSHMTLDEVFAEWNDWEARVIGELEAEALEEVELDREAEADPEFRLPRAAANDLQAEEATPR